MPPIASRATANRRPPLPKSDITHIPQLIIKPGRNRTNTYEPITDSNLYRPNAELSIRKIVAPCRLHGDDGEKAKRTFCETINTTVGNFWLKLRDSKKVFISIFYHNV